MADKNKVFDKAVAFVGASKVNTSTETKLTLYAYYKIATSGITPQALSLPRPGMLDFQGKAKYDAWSRLGAALEAESAGDNPTVDMARERYIAIAKDKLGFAEHSDETIPSKAQPSSATHQREMTADELLDADDDEEGNAAGAKTGMVSVSTMNTNDHREVSESNLHELAAAGKTDEIRKLAPSSTDCNTLDEYGLSPLHLAVDRGHVDTATALLEKGADPLLKDSEGGTAIDTAQILEDKAMIVLLQGWTKSLPAEPR